MCKCIILIPEKAEEIIQLGEDVFLKIIEQGKNLLTKFKIVPVYDPNNFTSLITSISGGDGYLNLNFQLRRRLGSWAKNYNEFGLSKESAKYYQWQSFPDGYSVAKETLSEIQKFAIETARSSKLGLVIFDLRLDSKESKFTGFKDHFEISELPDFFCHIPIFRNIEELEVGLNQLFGLKIDLDNKSIFNKTAEIVKGAAVYQEILTMDFWYFDTNHLTLGQPHYEVFGSTNKRRMKRKIDLEGNEIALTPKEKKRTLGFKP